MNKDMALYIRQGILAGYEGNILARALVGKVGMEEAQMMLNLSRTAAAEDADTEDAGLTIILRELDITENEAFALLKAEFNGAQPLVIAKEIERDAFIVDPS
jgi:hypothetical protein